MQSTRRARTVACGLAFGKIYDLAFGKIYDLVFAKTFGGTFGDMKVLFEFSDLRRSTL